MKKILSTLFILLIALVLIAPFGFSFWAEAKFNRLLQNMNNSGLMVFTLIKFDRGWFRSTALVEGEMSGEIADAYRGYQKKSTGKTPLDTPKVILRNVINHGPIPFMTFAGGNMDLMPQVAVIDTRLMKGIEDTAEPLITMDYGLRTRFPLAGRISTVMSIPQWSGPLENGRANLEWKGLNASLRYSEDFGDVDMDVKAPYLLVDGNDARVLMEGLSIDSKQSKGIEDLPLGTGEISIAKIEFQNAKTHTDFRMQDTRIDANSTATGDNIDTEMKVNVKQVLAGGDTYGPAVYSLSLRNLDAGAIARINRQVKELQKQRDMPPDQAGMMMGAALLSELNTLLKKGPVIEIPELSLVSPFGKMLGTARVTVDTSRPEMLSNPLLLKDALIGEVDLEVPEELLVAFTMASLRKELSGVDIKYSDEQVKAMARTRVQKRMDALVAGGMFVKVDNMYKFSASYKDGQATLNGHPFQIPAMGGRH